MDERCISCELLCIIISVYIHRQKHLSNISHSTEISATSESSQPDQISPIYHCDLGLTSFPARRRCFYFSMIYVGLGVAPFY